MWEYLEALVLGIVQGLTEFLPVSSSGHLEIMKFLLKDDSLAEQSMMTTVFLHFATALSTVVVFRKDILKLISNIFTNEDKGEARKYALYILISMVPAVIIGLLFDEILESFFHQKIFLVSLMLIVTGIILFISERIEVQEKSITVFRAAIIGIAQAVAITPGISRSGSTIATSLILGVDKAKAARFSFLMVIPLIFGKIAKDFLSGDLLAQMPSMTYLMIGFISAFITGIFACTFMIGIVKKAKLSWFAYYCFLAGGGLIVYNLVA